MPAVETILLTLGSTIVRSTIKVWLKDNTFAQDASLTFVDALTKWIPNIWERRSASRQFEQTADLVAARLAPLIEVEFSTLAAHDLNATVIAATTTLSKVALTSELLLAHDLDPAALEAVYRAGDPDAASRALLPEAGEELYNLLLTESCNYIVELATALPGYQTEAMRELLQRETQIVSLLTRVLDALPALTAAAERATSASARFETAYRRGVVRALDHLELFGIDLPETAARYRLEVAYITLSSLVLPTGLRETPDTLDVGPVALTAVDDDTEAATPVDDVLASASRLLILGAAGSGKTTLLQWLAVQSARRAFADPLANLSDKVPFFIRLRGVADANFPPPEDFPKSILPQLAGAMPLGWAHDQLFEGRALVLIDGIDEVAETAREKARIWIEALVATYPDAAYVVTSRPTAIDTNWLTRSDFSVAELQPMSSEDVRDFIDHWHRAAADSSAHVTEDGLLRQGARLAQVIRETPALRALATSPLLCAMLCALNRDRRANLPNDRVELYRIALEALLERRDAERELALPGSRFLTRQQKELLLQDLAYWLLVNDRTDCSIALAIGRMAERVSALRNVDAPPDAIFSYLLERTGLLREPIPGRIDFVHRTFQEYLAAKELLRQDSIGQLLQNAQHDSWREVVVLAGGHAGSEPQLVALLEGLLSRGDASPDLRHRLHFLAVACLQSAESLPQQLEERITSALKSLIPPTTMTEAADVASASNLAVPLLLSGAKGAGVRATAATVRALSLIGTDSALTALGDLATDSRVTVAREVVRAWDGFDPERYAATVLTKSPLDHGKLRVTDAQRLMLAAELPKLTHLTARLRVRTPSLPALPLRPVLSELDLSGSRPLIDLVGLESQTGLETLNISRTSVRRLSGVEGLTQLRRLDAMGCRYLEDVSPAGGLSALSHLNLIGALSLADLGPLAGAPVVSLLARELPSVTDLAALRHLSRLRYLSLGCKNAYRRLGPDDLPAGLQRLTLSDWLEDQPLHIVQQLADLIELRVIRTSPHDGVRYGGHVLTTGGSQRLVERPCPRLDVTALSALHKLKYLAFVNAHGLSDLGPLCSLQSLETLTITGGEYELDLEPIARLPKLERLFISYCKVSNFRVLESLPSLRVLDVTRTDGVVPDSLRERGVTVYGPKRGASGAS